MPQDRSSTASLDADRCASCGTLDGGLRAADRVTIVDSRDLSQMLALLAGALDQDRCRACGAILPTRPSLVVTGIGWGETLDGTHAATINGTVPGARNHEDLAGLRAAVQKHLRNSIEPLREVLATVGDARDRMIDVHWRGLHAEAFAAALLALSGYVPGVMMALELAADEGEEAIGRKLEGLLGSVQARAFTRVLDHLFADATAKLEDELTRFVAPQLVQSTTAVTLEKLDGLLSDDALPPLGRFALLALHASACEAAGRENPLISRWATEYVRFSLIHLIKLESGATLRFAIDPTRAAGTLSYDALMDAARGLLTHDGDRLPDEQLELVAALDEVVSAVGHPTLIPQLLESMSLEAGLEELEQLLADVARADTEVLATRLIHVLASAARTGRSPEQLIALYEHAIAISDGSEAARAWLLSILGSTLIDFGHPRAFLDVAGDAVQAQEEALPAFPRARLWNERARALRLVGRPRDALVLGERVAPLLTHEEDRIPHAVNCAIYAREAGHPDRALDMLEELRHVSAGEQRVSVLESLAATYLTLGRYEPAVAALQEALPHAQGPGSTRRLAVLGQLASLAARMDDRDAAIAALVELPISAAGDSRVLMHVAEAHASLLRRNPQDPVRADVDAVAAELVVLAERLTQAGSLLMLVAALGVHERLLEAIGDAGARRLLERRVDIARELGQEQPVALVALAERYWKDGDLEAGRRLLRRVPDALASELGGIVDPSVTLTASDPLASALRRLIGAMLDGGRASAGDVRIVAELQRDGGGRARIVRRADAVDQAASALREGLDDDVLARLAPAHGALHVMECFESSRGLHGLLTSIAGDGAVEMRALAAPPVSLGAIAPRLRSRLDGWRPGRTKDPLDFQPWRAVEHWLHDRFAVVSDGDHVVFIDHPNHAGLPWHAAAGARWTSSYAAGWSELLRLHAVAPRTPTKRLGVLSVPARGDRPETTARFAASLARSADVARGAGIDVRSAIGDAADHTALIALLLECDVAKLICHGVVETDQHEVALLLAHDGQLPLQHAVAATTDRSHRFSWRDAEQLTRAPRSIFSAACSSGVSHVAGLGERIGLYGALRLRGTRAIVAPAWDGVATDVLDVLDDALERHLRGDASLAACVRGACEAAERRLPRWRAWTLCLEGDWR